MEPPSQRLNRVEPHKVWKSIGTPLSDATEEKQWRKLLRRAIFVRNKDASAPTCACRLGCPDTESMLHLFNCRARHTKPLWTACLKFIGDIGCGVPDRRLRGLIFGQWLTQRSVLRRPPPFSDTPSEPSTGH